MFYQGVRFATLMCSRARNYSIVSWLYSLQSRAGCEPTGGAAMLEGSGDEGHVFEHDGPQLKGGDALLRALSGRSASSSCSALAASQARQSATALMASSVEQSRGAKRHYDLLTTKEQIGRQYAVARRLAAGQRGYLSEWAKQNYPERCLTESTL